MATNKGMKTVGVTDYTNQTHLKHFGWKNVNTPQKMRKYLSNVHNIGGAHLQCVKNHYVKFEYKGMKTVGVTDYTHIPFKHFGGKENSSTPPK